MLTAIVSNRYGPRFFWVLGVALAALLLLRGLLSAPKFADASSSHTIADTARARGRRAAARGAQQLRAAAASARQRSRAQLVESDDATDDGSNGGTEAAADDDTSSSGSSEAAGGRRGRPHTTRRSGHRREATRQRQEEEVEEGEVEEQRRRDAAGSRKFGRSARAGAASGRDRHAAADADAGSNQEGEGAEDQNVRSTEAPAALVASAASKSGGDPALPPLRLHRPLFPMLYAGPDWAWPPTPLRGELPITTSMGRFLYDFLRQKGDVHFVLELGTGYGGGSSWCIAQALRETMPDPDVPTRWLHTVELHEEPYIAAQAALARLPVTVHRGTSVGTDVAMMPPEIPPATVGEALLRRSYSFDAAVMEQAWTEGGALAMSLCAEYPFDMVVIDGSPYTGYADWRAVLGGPCMPRFYVLRDTAGLRASRVMAEMDADTARWRRIGGGTDKGIEWAAVEDTNVPWDPEKAAALIAKAQEDVDRILRANGQLSRKQQATLRQQLRDAGSVATL